MGGDKGPKVVVPGAIDAILALRGDARLILVGREEEIRPLVGGIDPAMVEIVHASETIDMHESPATAIRRKKDASITVAFTVAASLTLLPALLGFAGDNIERTKWRGLVAAGFVAVGLAGAGLKVPALAGIGFLFAAITIIAGFVVPVLKREVERKPPKPRRETIAYRWSRVIQHRPWTATIAAAAVLLILAVPFLQLRLGFSDESNFADKTTTKKAYNLIVDGFGKGSTGPIYLVASIDNAEQMGALAAINDPFLLETDPVRKGMPLSLMLGPVTGPGTIPEPASIIMWVAISGIAGLVVQRRRRRPATWAIRSTSRSRSSSR